MLSGTIGAFVLGSIRVSSEKRWAAVARKGGPRGRTSGSLHGSTHDTVPVLVGVFGAIVVFPG